MSTGADAPAARWRLAWLFAAPHRLAFAAAALLFALSAAWWALVLWLPVEGIVWRPALPPAQAHALVMSLGFMPLFFCGFLFTAGPRWLGRPPVDARMLLAPVLAMGCGWVVFLIGAQGRDADFGRTLGSFGLAAVAWGWSDAWRRFVAMLRASRVPDRLHARLVAVAGGVGALCLWAAAVGTGAALPLLVRAATGVALWGFVGGVFVVAAHRLVPFLGAALPELEGRWPNAVLALLVASVGAQALFALVEAVGGATLGALPGAWRVVQAALEVPTGVVLLALALRWARRQPLTLHMVAMLHVGFVWLGLALTLCGVSHALAAASDGALSLGVAPVHAFAMGFLGSTLIAMVSRVSCGHGGRSIVGDRFVWVLFWVMQVAVLARVAAGVLAALGAPGVTPLILAAALVWCGGCIAWALRFGRWYGLPRPDGMPG